MTQQTLSFSICLSRSQCYVVKILLFFATCWSILSKIHIIICLRMHIMKNGRFLFFFGVSVVIFVFVCLERTLTWRRTMRNYRISVLCMVKTKNTCNASSRCVNLFCFFFLSLFAFGETDRNCNGAFRIHVDFKRNTKKLKCVILLKCN